MPWYDWPFLFFIIIVTYAVWRYTIWYYKVRIPKHQNYRNGEKNGKPDTETILATQLLYATLSIISGRSIAIGTMAIIAPLVVAEIMHWRDWSAFFTLLTLSYAMPYWILFGAKQFNRKYQTWLALFFLLGAVLPITAGLGYLVYKVLLSNSVSPIPGGNMVIFLLALIFSTFSLLPDLWRGYSEGRRNRFLLEQAERAKLERALIETELRALQAQVEPHFLYNTLSNVQYLIRHNTELADEMVTHLIAYLRTALPNLRGPASTLKREFQLAEDYLAIMAIRTGQRLHYSLDCPEELHDVEFPPLMLISLVENAIHHGIEPKVGAGNVRIGAHCTDGFVTVLVVDDGVGFRSHSRVGGGVGLANIRERLQGLYGDRAELEVTANEDAGVTSTISIPEVKS